MADGQQQDATAGPAQVWQPGLHPLGEDEELEFDPTAYDLLYPFQLEWPCLSFDILRDELGADRTSFPHTMYIVAGTQAASAKENSLQVARLTQLGRMQHGGDNDESEDESSDDDMDNASLKPGRPVLQLHSLPHYGGVNRVRAAPQQPNLVATWSDTGHVQVWDVKQQLQALNAAATTSAAQKVTARLAPLQVFKGHKTEGFALDWSPVVAGRLLSADCEGAIHVWEPTDAGRWAVSASPLCGHEQSVEDVQWSPTEAGVFASCGVDGHICIWDTRKAQPALRVAAHGADVNVISWNRIATCMIVSGCDDGCFRIWDLRHFAQDGFVANFQYHTASVTSVEWSVFDSTTLATSSADDQVAVWDLAVERDVEEEAAAMAADTALPPPDLPPQLLFVHQGQKDMKELHWHPQVPGVCISTASDGFAVWKAANCP